MGGREGEWKGGRKSGREGGREEGTESMEVHRESAREYQETPRAGNALLFGTWSSSEADFIPGSHVIGARGYRTHCHW